MTNDAHKIPRYRFKELRDQANLKLEDLADLVGISVSQLSRFESGDREPRVSELLRIADALKTPWQEFLISDVARLQQEPLASENPTNHLNSLLDVGQNVRHIRAAQKLSQNDLGERIGISQVAIKKIEDGSTVRSKYLPRIAAALGVPLIAIDPGYLDGLHEKSNCVRRRAPIPAHPTGLYYAREYRGLSQDELSRLSGVSKGTISKLERGQGESSRQLTRKWAEKFAPALNLPAERIMFWDKYGAPAHECQMTGDFKAVLSAALSALPGRDKQNELARRIGVEQPTVSRWVSGAVPLGNNYQKVFNVARELGVFGDIRSEDVAASLDPPPPRTVKVVGYVGAIAKYHYYDVGHGNFEEIPAPGSATDKTVAVEIKGDSLGKLLNKWYVFYDDVRRPVTPDLIGELCVVGLADGRILVKGIEKNHQPGHYDLVSNDEREPKIVGVKIEWAAKVKEMRPR